MSPGGHDRVTVGRSTGPRASILIVLGGFVELQPLPVLGWAAVRAGNDL